MYSITFKHSCGKENECWNSLLCYHLKFKCATIERCCSDNKVWWSVGRKDTKRSKQLSYLNTVEVHCCIVSLIRKELLEEITAEIHSVVQDVSIRRLCTLVTLMLGVWILFALAGAAVCIPPETISRRLTKPPSSLPLEFYAPETSIICYCTLLSLTVQCFEIVMLSASRHFKRSCLLSISQYCEH